MLLAYIAAAAVAPSQAYLRSAPPSVRLFIERRAGCNHWSGEEPYDRDRGQEIDHAVSEMRCDRLGADEAALRQRYRTRPDIQRLLTATADLDQ